MTVFMAQDQHNPWGYRGCVGGTGDAAWIQPISRAEVQPPDHVTSHLLCQARRDKMAAAVKQFTTICIKNGFVLAVSNHKNNYITSFSKGYWIFCLKLLIFDGAKWLQMWWWFQTKMLHMSTSIMAGFTLDVAVWANIHLVLHSINNNTVWKPQVIYW